MYVLILIYVLSGTTYNLPKETYQHLSYCVTALDATARSIHKQGGTVTSASCVKKD